MTKLNILLITIVNTNINYNCEIKKRFKKVNVIESDSLSYYITFNYQILNINI